MDPLNTVVGQQIVNNFSQYGYFALAPLFIIEGPTVGFISGILISVGALSALPVFLMYVGGKVISDTVLYLLAKNGSQLLYRLPYGDRLLARFEYDDAQSEPEWADTFRQRYFSFMMFGKIAPIPWVAEAAAIAAGIFHIPWRKFYLPVFIGQPVWSAAVIALGYYFGDTVQNPEKLLSEAGVFTAIGIVIFILYYRYLHERIKDKVFYQFFPKQHKSK